MKRKPIFPMLLDELDAMPTRQLIGRLHQLRMCIESLEHDDLDEPPPDNGQIRYKQTDEWRGAYRDVKAVLETREHVRRKGREGKSEDG